MLNENRFRIIHEPSISKLDMYYNVYQGDKVLSSHIHPDDANAAFDRAVKMYKEQIKPKIYREVFVIND